MKKILFILYSILLIFLFENCQTRLKDKKMNIYNRIMLRYKKYYPMPTSFQDSLNSIIQNLTSKEKYIVLYSIACNGCRPLYSGYAKFIWIDSKNKIYYRIIQKKTSSKKCTDRTRVITDYKPFEIISNSDDTLYKIPPKTVIIDDAYNFQTIVFKINGYSTKKTLERNNFLANSDTTNSLHNLLIYLNKMYNGR